MPSNQTDVPVGISEEEYTQLLNEEHLGNWWLPENADRKIAGALSFDRDHRATLELMEAFEVTLDRQMQVGINYPLVLGQDRSGKNFALMDCWKEGGHTGFPSGRSWSTVRSQKVLMGLPDEFDASLSFDSLELRSPSFSQWWTSGASELITRSSRKHVSVALNIHRPPPVHLCTWKGISLDFISRPVTGATLRGTKQLTVSEDVCLRLTSQHKRPLSEFLIACNKTCTFMAVMLQDSVTMSSVTVYSHAHMIALDGSPDFLLPVGVVSPIAGCTNAGSSDKEHECLLPVQVSLSPLHRILRRWSTITLSSKPFEASCSEPNVCNTLALVIASRWQLQLWRDLIGLVLQTRLGRRENGTNG